MNLKPLVENLSEALDLVQGQWRRNRIPEDTINKEMEKIQNIISPLPLTTNPTPLQKTLTMAIILIARKPWTLKSADKNLGLVLMRNKIYQELLNKELDPTTFKEVSKFPFNSIVLNIKMILMQCHIPRSDSNRILQEAKTHNEPCPFFALPKIHKTQISSRPITAQHSYVRITLKTTKYNSKQGNSKETGHHRKQQAIRKTVRRNKAPRKLPVLYI